MRGSTPLDVAASSVMDNNGLALALEEPDLDKVSLTWPFSMQEKSVEVVGYTYAFFYLDR